MNDFLSPEQDCSKENALKELRSEFDRLQLMVKETTPQGDQDENQLRAEITKMEQLLTRASSEIDQIQQKQVDLQVRFMNLRLSILFLTLFLKI